MIINILKKQDLDLVKELPIEVLSSIEAIIEILDENYGTERIVEDLCGYIAIVDEGDITTFKEEILKETIPEYIDDIEGAEYFSALFLLSDDFSVVSIWKRS